MSQPVKMQHYVPRLYLRSFSTKVNGNTFLIYCFDKIGDKVFRVNIENIGGEKYFYDLDRGKNQVIENMLAKLEGIFSESYAKLLQSRDIGALTSWDKGAISLFMAMQEIRTKEHREALRKMAAQMKEKLSKYPMTEEFSKELDAIQGEATAKRMQIQSMVEHSRDYAKIIGVMKWILLVNKTKQPNWTSDHPITRYNNLDLGPYGNLGLLSPGIEVYFPLSSDLTLLVTDPALSILPDKFEVKDENVTFQNYLQVTNSTRHIFSVNDDFSLAKQVISDHPELKDTNRNRFTVA